MLALLSGLASDLMAGLASDLMNDLMSDQTSALASYLIADLINALIYNLALAQVVTAAGDFLTLITICFIMGWSLCGLKSPMGQSTLHSGI